MALTPRLPKVREHREHCNERTRICYPQAPPWVRGVAHVGDAGEAKPHLEHNPFSLLETCHAMPLRKLHAPAFLWSLISQQSCNWAIIAYNSTLRAGPICSASSGKTSAIVECHRSFPASTNIPVS